VKSKRDDRFDVPVAWEENECMQNFSDETFPRASSVRPRAREGDNIKMDVIETCSEERKEVNGSGWILVQWVALLSAVLTFCVLLQPM
jgi:hypothetical protein